MSKTLLMISAAIFALSSAPSAATILFSTDQGSLQPDENVLFSGPAPVGNTATGFTNQTNTPLNFTGIESLSTPSGGQARITTADGGLSQLSFALDDGFGFTEFEFNIFGSGASATSVFLSFTDQLGGIFTETFAIGNGENKFVVRSIDDQIITFGSFLLNGDVRDARQFRIGGITEIDGGPGGGAIPEPQVWAMMLAGFGLVGAAMRRRSRPLVVTA